jgi:hypothetical protein
VQQKKMGGPKAARFKFQRAILPAPSSVKPNHVSDDYPSVPIPNALLIA